MPSNNGHGAALERVALYLRVSSEEQRDRETIEIQREFLEPYCELYEFEIVKTYADDGISGTISLHERPEGRQLLDDAKESKFQAVLVYRLDRLGRSLLVMVDAHDRLASLGVSLRSATESIETVTPSGRLIFQMLASFAEYERLAIGERTRAGLHRAYRGGRHMGAVPYGYRTDEQGHLQIVPEEAADVRQIIESIANGSTLYAQAKRLNDLGLPAPGWRYGSEKRRPGSSLWSVMTISNIVRQRAYSGTHEVKINGGADIIEQTVPAIVDAALQERAQITLKENKRYPHRKNDRKYLLSGLVTCAVCGSLCGGHPTTRKGKKYFYYTCRASRTNNFGRGRPHKASYVTASWLEEMVWGDVRQFLEDPGEVLERVREQLGAGDTTDELEARREELGRRLAEKQAEKDRYVRVYAQRHISEDELETYLLDLKNQTENLRLLLASVEAELSQKRAHQELTEAAHAWLVALRERIAEVEEDTEEAFRARRQLVKLLVQSIIVGKNHEGCIEVRITYRFGPPGGASEGSASDDRQDLLAGDYSFVGSLMNGNLS
jgi:site-specific DNA recombinase